MSQIKIYSISSPITSKDKWIGTEGLDGITTKNFTAQDVSDFVRSGLSPIDGGVLKITEIDIPTLETDISTTVNLMDPSYIVSAYEIVYFFVEGLFYILKLVDVTIGVDGFVLSNQDFITLPVNTGLTGNGIESIDLVSTVGLNKIYRITYTNSSFFDFTVTNGTNGTNGTDGTDGTDGISSDMTRTSTTSLSINNSGSKTLSYTSSSNLGWINGMRLRFFHDSSNYMEGIITLVSSTSVTIISDYSIGSGTYTSWNIGVTGDSPINSGLKGDTKEVVCDNTYLTNNFETSGLGKNERLGWAIMNGATHGSVTVPNDNGKVVIAYGTDYTTLGATGGSKDAVVVEHSHNFSARGDDGGGTPIIGYAPVGYNLSIGSGSGSMLSTGESGTNKNMQPYVVRLRIMKL